MAGLLIVAVIALAAVAYGISLKIHPWIACGRCHGSGKSRGTVWKSSYGSCASCAGRGRHPRLGVRVLQRDRARRLAPPANHKKTDERK